MDRQTPQELHRNVVAQADFRLKFGVLVASAIVAVYFLAPYAPKPSAALVLGMYVLYILYSGAARYLTEHIQALTLRDLVIITAVIDPLFLSAWLFVSGDSAFLVVGMYLFTIMGFGFRVGAMPMHVCQAISLAGFLVVVTLSPTWQHHILFALSHVVLLVLVPVYASFLIRRIQNAKAMAEHEIQAKSRLLAKVSHELRTPLTGITAAAQLLEIESRETDTVKRALAIQQLAGTLETEIKQLLELSTFEHKRERKAKKEATFSLKDMAERVYKAVEPIAEGKGLQAKLEFDEAISQPVIGVEDGIVAVLTNLAGNAVKFTNEGSIILEVRLAAAGDDQYQVWFGVRDTGIGIAPEHLEKIFEPFFQVDEGRHHSAGGTGLGTSIARELVRSMGGDLQVTSRVGEGSVFWFTLDLPVDRSVPVKVDRNVAGKATVVRGKRVLIADDNATNLDLMAKMIEKDGHIVTAVAGGEDALAELASKAFDIIFLDYNMEDIDGAMVLQTYRFGRVETASAFFVTADTTPQTTAMLEELGALGVIYKPVTFDKIRNAFAKAFPDEGSVPVAPANPSKRDSVGLSSVPVEYVDMDIIEALREVRDAPEFIARIVGEGMADLEALQIDMKQALVKVDVAAVHRVAHTMKGVSLNVGAVRLAALADRMMGLSHEALAANPERLNQDVASTTRSTLKALHGVRRSLEPPHAVND